MLGAVAPRKVPQEEVPHRKPFYDRLKRGIHPFTVRGGNSFTFRVSSRQLKALKLFSIKKIFYKNYMKKKPLELRASNPKGQRIITN